MAHIWADRVKDTTTTTGTGAITVSGTAPTTFRTFSAVCATSDTVYYCIEHQTANEWEVGLGTYSASNQITRTTVLASSNAGSAVNFSAGTKNVFAVANASYLASRVTATLATSVASTSGTAIDFTGLPSGTKLIFLEFEEVSTNGSSVVQIQIGDSGGVETTNYKCVGAALAGSSGAASYTAGFGLGNSGGATRLYSGLVTLALMEDGANKWTASGGVCVPSLPASFITAGCKSLSATLDRVRVTTVSGSDTFDNGSINLMYVV